MPDQPDNEIAAQLAAMTEQLAKLQAANEAKDALLAAAAREASLTKANADLAACDLPPAIEKRLSALIVTAVDNKGTVANLSGGTETTLSALLGLGKDLGAMLKDKAPGVTGLGRAVNPPAAEVPPVKADLAAIEAWVASHPGSTRMDAYAELSAKGKLSAEFLAAPVTI